MEQDQLHSIAQALFAAMADSTWKEQPLDTLEGDIQRLLAQLGNTLLEDFILPRRIADIERQVADGARRCPTCEAPWRRHKAKPAIHPKTLFGKRLTLTRTQYVCRSCRSYSAVADAV